MEIKQRVKYFTPGTVLKALTADFLKEDVCRSYILKALHPDDPRCPKCGTVIEDEHTAKNFWELRRCECKRCGRWFTATTNTILHNSQLSMRQTYLLAVFLAIGMPAKDIARALHISPGTVRLWKLKLFVH